MPGLAHRRSGGAAGFVQTNHRQVVIWQPCTKPRPEQQDPGPPIYDGNREALEGFVAQLRLKLFSDTTRFPTPAIRMAYTFNRQQGRAQAQVLPFIKGDTINLNDADNIIQILHNAFGDLNPAATARAKLSTLKQGKKEFNTYFADFQMLVSKLN